MAAEIPCKIPCKKLTWRTRHKAMRRRSIITVGSGDAEIKIYTLRRKDGYPSLQCAWYELGQRKTKTFASMDAAKLFAQQTHQFVSPRSFRLPIRRRSATSS